MTDRPRTVTLLMPSIRSGGIERLMSILLNGFERSRVAPSLMVLHTRELNQFYRRQVPDDVPVIDLGKRSAADALKLVRRIARHYDAARPDAVLGFMTYANLLLLAARRVARHKPLVVVTEHTDPATLRKGVRKRLQSHAARLLYPDAAAVIAVSAGMRDALVSSWGLPQSNLVVLHNPYDPSIERLIQSEAPLHSWLSGEIPVVVSVGRLTRQKGYPHLLEAIAMIRRERPVRLVVFGEGEDRPALERLRDRLGLRDAVDFAGFEPNPFAQMARADAFALPSLWEGFPFALVEALRSGAAVVSSDCPYGPGEIVEEGLSGLLVPPADARALADALRRILDEPGLADRLRQSARERADMFAPDAVVRRYEDLLRGESPAA